VVARGAGTDVTSPPAAAVTCDRRRPLMSESHQLGRETLPIPDPNTPA
jgi:hypothetical protein